jgi:hypothetical protein
VARYLVPPLVTEIGDGKHLVGIEARLLLAAIDDQFDPSATLVSIPLSSIAELERIAADRYREWATSRLKEVIALRRGIGREVLQAISVGMVLVLLVNRSTSPERAQIDRGGRLSSIDNSLYLAAEAFAETITTGRGRSSTEKKLKGGYALSEAKRRLAERLVVEPLKPRKGESRTIYLAEGAEHDVVGFLAHDLARRPGMEVKTLSLAFDRLVSEFRRQTESLATHAGVHERAGETARLRKELLTAFEKARPVLRPTR